MAQNEPAVYIDLTRSPGVRAWVSEDNLQWVCNDAQRVANNTGVGVRFIVGKVAVYTCPGVGVASVVKSVQAAQARGLRRVMMW